MAITLLSFPKILLLDEPTTGLDASVRKEIYNLINGYRNFYNDRMIILSSHNIEEIDRICNKMTVIKDGSLRCYNNIDTLLEKYVTGYYLDIKFINFRDEIAKLNWIMEKYDKILLYDLEVICKESNHREIVITIIYCSCNYYIMENMIYTISIIFSNPDYLSTVNQFLF